MAKQKIIILHISILLLCLIMTNTCIEAKWIARRRTRNHTRIIKKQAALEYKQIAQEETINLNTQVDVSAAVVADNPEKQEQTIFEQDKHALPPELRQKKSDVQNSELVKGSEQVKTIDKDEEAHIEFYFENADLQNLIKQAENIFGATFIPDDIIQPIAKGGKALKGNKISFKTHKPLTKKQAWDLFVTFLDIAGFAVVPQADPTIYRIKPYATARQSAIPAYIGIDPEKLPDNNEIIRYVYFIKNSTVKALQPIIDSLRRREAGFVVLQEHKAFILTDRSYNVKTLMIIIKELDKVSMPQAMSVLKLRQADAQDIKKLYDSLMQRQEGVRPRFFGRRKQPSSLYFPENTQIIVEPRTNALILLGQKDAIKKIEDFIVEHVDIDLDQPYSPFNVYQLKYADAETIADIMNNVTKFGLETSAGKAGGIRGGDKYLKQMSFTPEKSTNQIIIQGRYEDYMEAKKIIDKLDEPQPQVAIEVLLLSIDINDTKNLGIQIRSKVPGPDGFLGKNVKFQTSHLGKIIEKPDPNTVGVQRLLGNLINLAVGQSPGSTILTLGKDLFGIWGVFRLLKTISNVQVVSNPFLVATNKTKARVALGETRRVKTAEVSAVNTVDAFGNSDAKLQVEVTPQINSDGMIILKIDIIFDEFTSTDETSATMSTRKITTETIVADREVLALGGLIKNTIKSSVSKTPILGDIPILGWLFKSKNKTQIKTNLLVLFSTRIIEAKTGQGATRFTQGRIDDYRGYIKEMREVSANRDPIHRAFFRDKKDSTARMIDEFIFKKSNKYSKRVQKRKKRRAMVAHNKPSRHSKSKNKKMSHDTAGVPA